MQLGFIFSFVGAVAVALISHAALAQEFVPLATLPGIVFTDPVSLVNGFIRLTIVAAALLAVVRIIYGGFIYLTTEAISSKGDAKGIISDALSGLVLILVSILILQIINPDILNVRFFNQPIGSAPNNATNITVTRGSSIVLNTSEPGSSDRLMQFREGCKRVGTYDQKNTVDAQGTVTSFTAQCK